MSQGSPIILASASPRRRELLERVGLPLEVKPAHIDEAPRDDEAAVDHAGRLASAKADAVAAEHPGRWVLGADTVVEVAGRILGKAADADEARAMLRRLAGQVHRVTTAFRLTDGDTVRDRTVTTEVVMRAALAEEIDDYVAAGEWRGKAGAYAVQGMAAAFVVEVRGSFTNVVGLPLAEVVGELHATRAARVDYARGRPA